VDDRPLLSDLLVWVESKMEAEPIGLGPIVAPSNRIRPCDSPYRLATITISSLPCCHGRDTT
jgi:hypothetical protein